MGKVYLARQTDLGRQVVVKVMHDHIAADPKFRERFQRETLLMARFHLTRLADRLSHIPAAGEVIALAETGNHCRGAEFRDGGTLATAALSAAIDEIGRAVEGFYFGRFDVRAESVEALIAGRGFRILELNGVASEATEIYDPEYGAWRAWMKLCEQWRLAYAIGGLNRERGAATVSLHELLRRWRR